MSLKSSINQKGRYSHHPISKQKKLEHSAKPHVDELIIEQKLAEWWSVVSILLLLSH
jgi:hypothetical protein